MSRPSIRRTRAAPPAREIPADATFAVFAGRIVEIVDHGAAFTAIRFVDHAQPVLVPASALAPCPPGGPAAPPDTPVRKTALAPRE